MVGQGSVNHNSRAFNAKNTDPERSHLNITYCHENIKTVFHELFDEALKRYNDKQTRADRKIEDYYEKIRSSKQEKPFHEIILQVGNKDDMSAESEDGQLAAAVLDEYMRGFQERNPQLRVFSAHLHMDEATKMILAEAFTYAFWGCIVGCVIGLPLSKLLYGFLITEHFPYATWSLPVTSLIVIILFVILAAVVAAYAPARRIRSISVTETINEL
nr:plasmid recombination protein [Angelakisella massiliensis]